MGDERSSYHLLYSGPARIDTTLNIKINQTVTGRWIKIICSQPLNALTICHTTLIGQCPTGTTSFCRLMYSTVCLFYYNFDSVGNVLDTCLVQLSLYDHTDTNMTLVYQCRIGSN